MSFFESFDLFAGTYAAGVLVAACLALTGIWLIARDQVFAGAAFSQASVLGAAVGLLLTEVFHDLDDSLKSSVVYALTVIASTAAAVFIDFFSDRKSRLITAESTTGLVYLFSAAFSVLVVSKTPHGLQEVTSMLSSSVLGLEMADAFLFAVLLAATVLFTVLFYKKLITVGVDPAFASSVGIDVHRVRFLAALYTGLVTGLAIRYSGMLYSFGFLVLPGLLLRPLVQSPVRLILFAPLVAVAASFTGFWLAHILDLPLAQTSVAVIALPVIASFAVTILRR